ncbi:hypothetical protein JR316_0010694 [Psilocybe cubensis]|uniref:Uncharacterized protein n=2 Tax=Psilocybe cubensis TaxID=181762 RepID=A0ACB8GP11_PSICU|nr:hypothetical protein JR316_0010694 [Psilocybe cubensis]KAH9476779.1 hypothetical protein JR316_0010694 [Psilocybe cubensis]
MTSHSNGQKAGPSNSEASRYRVQTTDVLQDMRVNVSEEGSDNVIWFKERFLSDNEIVENIVHNPTSTIQWTIHRPLRGWYIRIRSPTFPPGVFIPLTPVPSSSPLHTDAALSFNSRTNITPPSSFPSRSELPSSSSQFTLQDEDITSSSSSLHSYPPTPTASTTAIINVHPPSPTRESSSSTLVDTDKTPKKSLRRPRPPARSQITQFLLAPSSIPPLQHPDANASFLSRALSLLKTHRPSHSSSFTLSRVVEPSGTTPPPYASQSSAAILQQQHPHLHAPLLVFHDHTPVLTVRSLTGVIELDKSEAQYLGVDTSFWIAVALTYLEFLEERESYLAASSD